MRVSFKDWSVVNISFLGKKILGKPNSFCKPFHLMKKDFVKKNYDLILSNFSNTILNDYTECAFTLSEVALSSSLPFYSFVIEF